MVVMKQRWLTGSRETREPGRAYDDLKETGDPEPGLRVGDQIIAGRVSSGTNAGMFLCLINIYSVIVPGKGSFSLFSGPNDP